MTVQVDGPLGGKQLYENISAVGIGHIRKDLVLVPADEGGRPSKVVEIAPDEWQRVVVWK